VQNPPMFRRLAGVVLAACALLALPAGAAAVEPPPGPRLAAIELIESKGSQRTEDERSPLMSLATIDPSTGEQRRFLRAELGATGHLVPSPFHAPAWSPDGSLIAFAGNEGGGESAARDRIFLVSPGGSGARPVPGTLGGSSPVLSPDGFTLAFARSRFEVKGKPGDLRTGFYYSTTTWVVDLRGGEPRRLTRWRNGLSNTPGSFGADGSSLLLTKEDSNLEGPRIVQVSLADGSSRQLFEFASEPAVSPDGSRIAFSGYLNPDLVEAEENQDYLASELYVARIDGTQVKRLSRTSGVLESSPGWDPSGQRIGYVQFRADTSFVPALGLLFPTGNALMQVNADGGCRKKILSLKTVAFYGAAWRPGAGREAGPLAC
jgi:Tol biopolymer transport system component